MTAILSAPSRRRIPEPPPPQVEFASGVYVIVARCGERTARAICTLHGWHIRLAPRCRRPGGPLEVDWLPVDTRDGAELALTRLLMFGTTS